MSQSILVIEDDREIASTIIGMLEAAEYEVRHATNGIDGQKIIQSEEIDLVITDMMMPKLGGFPVLEFLKTLDDPPKVIMMTANEGGRHKAYAEMLGVVEYLRKPFAMEALLDAVRRALDDTAAANPAKSKMGPLKRVRKKSSE